MTCSSLRRAVDRQEAQPQEQAGQRLQMAGAMARPAAAQQRPSWSSQTRPSCTWRWVRPAQMRPWRWSLVPACPTGEPLWGLSGPGCSLQQMLPLFRLLGIGCQSGQGGAWSCRWHSLPALQPRASLALQWRCRGQPASAAVPVHLAARQLRELPLAGGLAASMLVTAAQVRAAGSHAQSHSAGHGSAVRSSQPALTQRCGRCALPHPHL